MLENRCVRNSCKWSKAQSVRISSERPKYTRSKAMKAYVKSSPSRCTNQLNKQIHRHRMLSLSLKTKQKQKLNRKSKKPRQ